MKKLLAVACLLILACAPPSAAQNTDDKSKSAALTQALGESLPPELRDAFKPVELPEGRDAWALQIVTRGGIAGRGRGDVTVTSDGRVTCAPATAPCALKQAGDPFPSLSRLVAAAKPSKWKNPATGACNDCYLTLFVLQRRAGNGRERTHTLYWDDTTAGAVPADVKQILRAVAGLTFVPARVL
jgi:hypothetical protein